MHRLPHQLAPFQSFFDGSFFVKFFSEETVQAMEQAKHSQGWTGQTPATAPSRIWQAFYPNPHQMILGSLQDEHLNKIIWIDMGPRRRLPDGLPRYFSSARLTLGYVNSMVELQGKEGGLWCFSTSRESRGYRALTIGTYDGTWDVRKLNGSHATDIYNLLHEGDDGGQPAE